MLKARIRTALPSELALKRISEGVHRDEDRTGASVDRLVYAKIDGLRFTTRRSAFYRPYLHGELAGIVEPRDGGSTIHARAMGADWSAMYAGAGLAAAVFFTLLLGDSTDLRAQFVYIVMGACCLGASLFVVGGVFADWRFLMRHLHELFPDATP